MKEGYWLFGALILFHFGRVLYFYYQKRRYKQADVEIADYRYDQYLALREETFMLKPEDLGTPVSVGEETAFAIILEIHAIHTLQAIVAFANGEVWTFNTMTGRKYIQDSNEDDMRTQAIEAVGAAQYHFARMRTNNTDKLLPGYIKFHILTNIAVYSVGGSIAEMLHQSLEWKELATKMLAIADELNKASKNNPIKRVYTKIAIKRTKPANL